MLSLMVPQIQYVCIIHYIITVLITLTGLLSACTRKKKNDHNKISKIFHQHNFYMAMPIFLLLSKKNKHHFFQLVTLRKSMYNLYIFVHLQYFTTNIFPELLTYI